ncbi:MAG: hypothetical protein ACTHKF_02165 [Candidatus Nitrosocosmicus sp.]
MCGIFQVEFKIILKINSDIFINNPDSIPKFQAAFCIFCKILPASDACKVYFGVVSIDAKVALKCVFL